MMHLALLFYQRLVSSTYSSLLSYIETVTGVCAEQRGIKYENNNKASWPVLVFVICGL